MLTDKDLAEIQDTIHTPGWLKIIGVFRDEEQKVLDDLYSPCPTNPDKHQLIGEAKIWNRATKIIGEKINAKLGGK